MTERPTETSGTSGQVEQTALVNHPGADDPVGSRSWLHAWAWESRAGLLRAGIRPDSCILSTRVGIAVLDRFDLPARPQAVFVLAQNKAAFLLAERGVPVADWPDDAWSVGVDATQFRPENLSPGRWPGHLVVIVRQPGEPRLLVDLSADQFDRPERRLVIGGPVFMDIDGPWTPHDPLAAPAGTESEPALIAYRPMPPGRPESGQWKSSSDWLADVESGRLGSIVDRVVSRLSRTRP